MARNHVSVVRLIVYSDYLCPWCYNASVRLRGLEDDFGEDLEIVWRTYLLRPEPRRRDAAKFQAYTQSWTRPGAEAESGTFRPWKSGATPPTHSIPAHRVAKAAARLGASSFHRIHDALLEAYFGHSRDISDQRVLGSLWEEQGLPAEAFAVSETPEILQEVLEDHAEAQSLGITGAPAARLEGNEAFLTGALPRAMYRRWIERQMAARRAPKAT